MTQSNQEIVNDGYQDLLKGFGVAGIDTAKSTSIDASPVLKDQFLADIWRGDGLAKLIVQTPINDAVRPWWTIDSMEPAQMTKLSKELDRLKLKTVTKEMGYWQRLYGGSICCIGFQDGAKEVREPVTGQNKPISFLKVYPRSAVMNTEQHIVKDPTNARFGLPMYYEVYTNDGSRLWHWTRVIEMKGEPLPDDPFNRSATDTEARYWGVSVLQGITKYLEGLGIAYQGIAALLREASVGKYTLHGLAAMLAGGNHELVMKRLTTMNAGKSILNAVVLDAGGPGLSPGAEMPAETFTRENVTFTGVPEVLDKMQGMVAGMGRIPESRMFGMQSKGLGGTDEGSTRSYYDTVGDIQETSIDDFVTAVVSKVNAYMKVLPNDFSLSWNSPWEPSQAEQVEMEYKIAQTDQINVELGAYSGDEVREHRYVGESGGTTMRVVGDMPAPEPTDAPPPPTTPMEKPAKEAKAPK